MNKKAIVLTVGYRVRSGKHVVESGYGKTATINVLRNMADMLEREYPNVKFKESK